MKGRALDIAAGRVKPQAVHLFILALWELPQNTLGVVLWALLRLLGFVRAEQWDRQRLFIETRRIGISLGSFVFWCPDQDPVGAREGWTREHEYGHTLQSRVFGPLYLVVVGIPSVSRASYSLWCLWRRGQPWAGYYDGWPEKQADRLGGVQRRSRRLG